MTSGRSVAQWCLVVEPHLLVEQSNAEQLCRLVRVLGRRIGCGSVALLRPLTRPNVEQGPATDVYDWLKQ